MFLASEQYKARLRNGLSQWPRHDPASREVASAILPGMAGKRSTKPRVAIVGAGNLGRALAVAVRAAGYSLEQIISRGNSSSLRQARRLARELGASAVSVAQAQVLAD